eukprot:jgi/Psemu1/34825/gm1.34825_g
MVLKLKFKVDNPCWVKANIDPTPYPVQIVASPVSSLNPYQSPSIQVKTISLIDPNLALELKSSLQIKVNPNAPPPLGSFLQEGYDFVAGDSAPGV